MIARLLMEKMRHALSEYPVVTLFGPRQSGKTTLAKVSADGFGYVNLEDKETRELAAADYKAFFARHPRPLIIDEIQRLPEVVSAVQVLVDEDRGRSGQFVLTGSQQATLAEAVDESLAGRTSVLDLMPLSLAEISTTVSAMSTDAILLRGFMPELWKKRMNPTDYYRNYFRTYVERDVRRLVNVKDLILFERFVTLLAGRVGQFVNLSALAGEVGVSSTTLSSWLSILEASFLVYRLKPHYSNISKRMVKRPKIYFTEVGLAVYLLGIESEEQLSRDPLRGQLFENMVVMEAYKSYSNRGRDVKLSVLRTEKGFEVDLIAGEGSRIRSVEIKSSMTFSKNLIRNLEAFAKADTDVVSSTLVYDGETIDGLGSQNVSAVNFRNWSL